MKFENDTCSNVEKHKIEGTKIEVILSSNDKRLNDSNAKKKTIR